MVWIMLVFIHSATADTLSSVEFSDEKACHAAQQTMSALKLTEREMAATPSYGMSTACVAKASSILRP